MGDHRATPPLVIHPRLSRRLAIHAAWTHGLAFAVATALPIGLFVIPLMLAISVSAIEVFLVKVLRRAPWSIRSATWRSDGSWLLTFVSGKEREAELSPATFVGLPLIVLNFRLGRRRRCALPLCSDALDADSSRRLRQRLRIEGGRRALTPEAG
ncbi:protein YgfX [Thiocystis violacea]|uniref:protein YgfX n=1 Tax=Thiocystis violacea TaxID=13725 RepID=UPI0019076A4E|nr:protein YgfX [Thiocystis violacea]MBK1716824.1 hypothetical protein [Thiocystis violacea]